jgi:hypothetical protein
MNHMIKLLIIMLLCVIMVGCIEHKRQSVTIHNQIEIPVDNQGI